MQQTKKDISIPVLPNTIKETVTTGPTAETIRPIAGVQHQVFGLTL